MSSILIVLTSQKSLGNTDTPTGFWMEELATPYYEFHKAGHSVSVASPKGGEAKPDPKSLQDESQTEATRRFQNDPQALEAIKNTAALSSVQAEDYDAIVFPGGHGPMFDLASDKAAGELASKFYEGGKVVAAFCHGPAALITAVDKDGKPLVAGKRVTGFSNEEERGVGMTDKVPFLLEDKLRKLGGEYSAAEPSHPHVVVEGNLITGQNPASAGEMAKAILKALA